MRNLLLIILSALMLWTGNRAFGQAEEEKLDLPGDNLNLYAVLKLFQESETLEGFERKLNEEDSEINNLDLDGDNLTDYIRVEDNVEGNLHTISLKVAVSDNEDQDVAAFFQPSPGCNPPRYRTPDTPRRLQSDTFTSGGNAPYTDAPPGSNTTCAIATPGGDSSQY